MPEKALELLKACPYLSDAGAPETEGTLPLIRPCGGSAYRALDGSWRLRCELEIELFEHAGDVCAWLCGNVKELISLSAPACAPSRTGCRYTIKVTLDVEEN